MERAKIVIVLIVLLLTIIMVDQAVASGGSIGLRRASKSGECNGGGITGPANVWYKMGLTGFYFNFEGAKDNNIREVSAFLQNDSVPTHSTYSFSYHDNDEEDDFYYKIAWQQLPANSTIHTIQGNGEDVFTKLLGTQNELPGIPVLVGFKYRFTNDDHHLKRITAHVFKDNNLGAVYAEIGFRDKNGDDRYRYELVYAMIPDCSVVCTGCVDGSTKNKDTKAISTSFPALQGFDIRYSSDDHKMDRLGVLLKPSKVEIWFRDKNADDNFRWNVWYVDAVK